MCTRRCYKHICASALLVVSLIGAKAHLCTCGHFLSSQSCWYTVQGPCKKQCDVWQCILKWSRCSSEVDPASLFITCLMHMTFKPYPYKLTSRSVARRSPILTRARTNRIQSIPVLYWFNLIGSCPRDMAMPSELYHKFWLLLSCPHTYSEALVISKWR